MTFIVTIKLKVIFFLFPIHIGMLNLPQKNQREGLKYRVLRLEKNGKPKPYLYPEAYKYPLKYYLIEEPLPPYSEYKNWRYAKKSCCYSTGGSPVRVEAI